MALKLFVKVCLFLALFLSFNVFAKPVFLKENAYLNLGFGAFQCDQFKENDLYIKKHLRIASIFNVGIGYKFSDYMISDINLQYSNLDYKASDRDTSLKQKIRIISAMVNLRYNTHTNSLITPYITVGVGASSNQPTKLIDVTASLSYKAQKKINFAWNLGCGVIFNNLSSHYSMDIGYRYVDFGKIYTKNFSDEFPTVVQIIRGQEVIASVFFKF